MIVEFETVETGHGLFRIINSDDRISRALKKHKTWEQADLDACIQKYNTHKLPNHSTIIDLGSNLGTYSVPLAKYYREQTVYSIDCQKIMCDCLNQTLHLQAIDNCTVIHGAVSNCVNNDFSYKQINYQWCANFGAFELQPCEKSDFNGVQLDIDEPVPMLTVDSLQLENVGFIKMDIEGMEHLALQGALETISLYKPLLAFEKHKCDMISLRKTLSKLGYRLRGNSQSLTFASV